MSDPFVGRTIAHYEVVARVGGGAMGVVYQARDTRLGRLVALKFLPQQWSHDETAKQRFVREAQAASATNHPNICTIHDIETAADGQLFIVMAFYEGRTLKQRLESGPIAIDEALEIATQIADGLARAHAQGVVHRDVKPGNVILTEDGVRILDFGLATFVDALKLTAENSTIGTPAYMSPEQVQGRNADARSDVWAVGVLLYEMLAGHVPFQGSYAEAIAHAIRHEAPEPLRSLRPEIPEEVEQLVFRALHKEPSVRYESARPLARALRQVRGQTLPQELRTEPVPFPRPAPPLSDDTGWRLKVRAAVAAAFIIAAATAAILIWWPVERTNVVVAPFGNQTGDSDLDQYRLALTHRLTLSLSGSRDLRVSPYARVLEILRRFMHDRADISNRDAIQAITANTGAAIVVVPTLLREGGAWRARVELRDGRTSTNIWEHETNPLTSSLTRDTAYQLAATLAVDVEDHLKTRRSRIVEALMWLLPTGRHDRAGQMRSLDAAKAFADGVGWYEEYEYAQARQALRSAVQLDPRNPLILAWLSRAAQLTKDENEATVVAERALSALTAQTPRVDVLFTRAVADEARRDLAAAERSYRELAAERPDDPTWMMELASFFDRQASNADAVAAYHDALKKDARLLRPRLELCRLYSQSRLNEPAEAKMHGQTALNGYMAIGARGGEAQSRLCLVDTLAFGTEVERTDAWSHAQAARKIFEDLQYDYNLTRAERFLALIAGQRGQLAESIVIGETALARARAAGNTADQGTILNNLGVVYSLRGNVLKAAEYYQEAYRLYQSWHDEVRAAQIQANRGAMLIEYGKPDEGIHDIENALPVLAKLRDRRFQILCLRARATYYRNQGRHKEAMRELNMGLQLASAQNLAEPMGLMRTFLAVSQLEMGDYDQARQSLLHALKDGTGRQITEARIRLARTYVRLGDFAQADEELQRAERELQASPNASRQSLLSLVRGEWAFESGRPSRELRASFERARSVVPEPLRELEPSAIEARAYLGFMNAGDGRLDLGRQMIRDSIRAAENLRQLSLQARCRLLLAEIETAQRRFPEAHELLNQIPREDDERTLGPELRAQSHYLRGRLENAQGNIAAADQNAAAAQELIRTLEERLPQEYRALFAKRQTVRRLVR